MTQNYYVYKLFNPDCTEFYIGSTNDMKRRKRDHKHNCTNENSRDYNYKVYQYIRSNGGYSSWKYQILEHITTSINKYELHDLERKAIHDMKPSLNIRLPNRTTEQYRQDNRELLNQNMKQYYKNNIESIKQYKNQKFNCTCGGRYTTVNKTRHEKSKKHQNYINQ